MTKPLSTTSFDAATQKNIDSWLHGHYDEKTKQEIRKMIEERPQEAVDAFFTKLEFGTGGLRGVMGVGSNRMNFYTVMTATQGLANYINKNATEKSVFISYDSRHHSKEFAEAAARVLAANGIKVYLTKDLRPTPLVSFGCRFKKCTAAIMVTASHNPPEYNGYKVYWDDGGQVLPPHDTGIIAEVNSIDDVDQIKSLDTLESPLIEIVGEDVDRAYLDAIATLQIHPEMNHKRGNELSIVYTSLHGTGITLVPEALRQSGFTHLTFVDKQIIPDGDFPTASYPNPEERKALELGIQKLEEIHGDILIATDPDADRVGVAVQHQGKTVLLTGNQMAALSVEFLCRTLNEQGRIDSKSTFVKSIVTTELIQAICTHYKHHCVNVLTGFKYIAQKIREWEKTKEKSFVFGAEESYGYLLGTFARDKDAVVSSVLFCEMALWCKINGKTLVDFLHELYRKYGIYDQQLRSLKFEESKAGKEKMAAGMKRLRDNPPTEIAGEKVAKVEDFEPQTNMLAFTLEDGSKITVRPSGTEPKVKIYCEVVIKNYLEVGVGLQEANRKAEALIADTQKKILD
jgi:phosphoglucomutase/phosphomannomutase